MCTVFNFIQLNLLFFPQVNFFIFDIYYCLIIEKQSILSIIPRFLTFGQFVNS